MTAFARHLTAFLREHLAHDRKLSPNTGEAYAFSFQLLVCFAALNIFRVSWCCTRQARAATAVAERCCARSANLEDAPSSSKVVVHGRS